MDDWTDRWVGGWTYTGGCRDGQMNKHEDRYMINKRINNWVGR